MEKRKKGKEDKRNSGKEEKRKRGTVDKRKRGKEIKRKRGAEKKRKNRKEENRKRGTFLVLCSYIYELNMYWIFSMTTHLIILLFENLIPDT